MDRNRAQVFVCVYVCMFFFEDFSRLRALARPKVEPYDRVMHNTLLTHLFGEVMFPGIAWHVIIVPIGLTLR